ncbi:hypothetical protein AAC691_16930 [Nguyenibacter vanlangensis]|uniref:Uncharacterized protein n=1 Tax=Nguyenibacter vanlangensis TaxID=1216886 RepID=A0ABZ3D2H1_9PROT
MFATVRRRAASPGADAEGAGRGVAFAVPSSAIARGVDRCSDAKARIRRVAVRSMEGGVGARFFLVDCIRLLD